MKKHILALAFACLGLAAYSQELEFGVKAGFSKDKLSLDHSNSFSSSVEGNTTYNFGAYGRLKVMVIGLFVQPELMINTRASNITITDGSNSYPFLQSATYFEVPVMVGFKMLKLVRIYGGPNFQFLRNQKTEYPSGNAAFTSASLNQKNTGVQLGAGLDLAKFRFDVKYDFNAGSMGNAFNYNGNPVAVKNGMVTFQIGFKLFGIL